MSAIILALDCSTLACKREGKYVCISQKFRIKLRQLAENCKKQCINEKLYSTYDNCDTAVTHAWCDELTINKDVILTNHSTNRVRIWLDYLQDFDKDLCR